VGEIRDEHEKPEIVRENDQSYIVSGGMDVDGLAELFGTKLEGRESATIAAWSASWRDTFHVAAKPWMMGACDSKFSKQPTVSGARQNYGAAARQLKLIWRRAPGFGFRASAKPLLHAS